MKNPRSYFLIVTNIVSLLTVGTALGSNAGTESSNAFIQLVAVNMMIEQYSRQDKINLKNSASYSDRIEDHLRRKMYKRKPEAWQLLLEAAAKNMGKLKKCQYMLEAMREEQERLIGLCYPEASTEGTRRYNDAEEDYREYIQRRTAVTEEDDQELSEEDAEV